MDEIQKSGVLNADCARFLVAVGIGREGANNPYCGVVGIACSSRSVIEMVQRALGRQIRAVIDLLANGLCVPPEKWTPFASLHIAHLVIRHISSKRLIS